ncbi:hypothetical protein PanWU01x14_366050 [Parasponia andersonii]|uniref:RNase H type-1 domain-containing protein n=1 Tax=Parasponia andersonii TaxID=3476 RepID=A0A2P5A5S6_PARAD|nr:hypothetical protein PanWU01x14_366050 [Parasponia andersonii]
MALQAQTKQKEFQFSSLVSKPPFPPSQSRWLLPPEFFLKLNIDVVVIEKGGCIGLSGIIRDHVDEVMIIFYSNIKFSYSAEVAEALTLRLGISLDRSARMFSPLIESCNSVAHRLAKFAVANVGMFTWQDETLKWLLNFIAADLS